MDFKQQIEVSHTTIASNKFKVKKPLVIQSIKTYPISIESSEGLHQ